jgi:hypothetical protein
MAKKNQEAVPPAISTIPLPDQESPLVIDLPDGQKLVVGNIAHGTVIEVATWRGTGRPDSRTSRLMLGVSSSSLTQSESTTAQSESASEPAGAKKNPFKDFFESLFAKTPKAKNKKAVKEIDQLLREEDVVGLEDISPSDSEKKGSSRVSRGLEDSDDIQSWLDDLMNGAGSSFPSESMPASGVGKVKRISSSSRKVKAQSGAKRTAKTARVTSSRPRKSAKSSPRKTKKR